ncbi:MAG: NAD(P)/FAD-dependent oxidoreductase [Dehalococcoidia bacterium]|nr:NAD(P)/FAD-dependent oxidoreductase [Dehalococcoidia bacterium]
MSDYNVIVIGAGIGGLAISALMAKQGRKVLLLEQSDRVGGCCSTFEREGYHFDLGASLIEDIQVMDWCFQRLGTTLAQEVELIPPHLIFSIIFKDGSRMRYPKSIEESAQEIAKIAPEDVKGWYDFCKYMKAFNDAAVEGFFVKPANTLGDVVRMFQQTPTMLKYMPLFNGNYQAVLKKFFKSDKIRESLSYQCFYAGLPPELLPGLYAVIPYSEHEGIYYSKGGMVAIPAAFRRVGEKLGMTTRLNTLVKKVMVKDRRALGVVLADGSEITADLVISDINAKKLYLDLIGEEHLPSIVRTGVKSYEYAMSTPTVYLGVDYDPPLESHHTLATIPMEEMNKYWWDEYEQGRYPAQQFGIISCTTRSDPDLAPKGHNIIILTMGPGPYKLDGTTWEAEKKELLPKIIKYYSDRYIPDLEKHVSVAEFSTPADFEKRLLSPEGAIYALRQDVPHSICFRPAAKSKSIKGLYLVGASTHPGGGVPVVTASAMNAADLIEKYEK